jgi:ribosome-associated toxin RatA of RatAB toxin-antitoxin module
MFVTTSPEAMLKFLTDFEDYKTWFPRCSQSKVLARLNENESIVHLFFDAPWPVKNRDCVMRVKVEKDARTGIITITETSEPKYLKPVDGIVRINQLKSVWKFTPKDGGTEVFNEYSTNPGGNIPDWMTNTQSVENPLVTFESIQQKVVSKK